jgi:hypothetical protein
VQCSIIGPSDTTIIKSFSAQRRSILNSEGIPMTMQIGMVGSDGIVLASDTRWTKEPAKPKSEDITGRAVRYGTNGTKIKVTEGKEIAVSYAADKQSSGFVAEEIIAKLTVENAPDPIIAVQEIFNANASRRWHHVQGFIVLTHPAVQLFRFEIARNNRKWSAICEPVTFGYDVAGDVTNAAIYWAERYPEILTVEQLIPLAAHLIVSSHHLNTAGIGGLEIVRCDASGIRQLSLESTRELVQKANEWDGTIRDLFLKYQQQYTYDSAMTQ